LRLFKGDVKESTFGDVCIKKLVEGSTALTSKEFLHEAKFLLRLQHRNIIELIGVCTKSTPMYIITEYMINQDLRALLQTDKGAKLRLKDLIDMGHQVLILIILLLLITQ